MEVNSKTVKNKNIKLGDYIQIEKIKKLVKPHINKLVFYFDHL